MSGGTLFAVAFDADCLAVRGTAVPLVEGLRRASNRDTGAAQFAVSESGALAFVPGPLVGPEWGPQQLVLEDGRGAVKPLNLPPAGYRGISGAPDGKRIALAIDDANQSNLFTYTLDGSQPLQRLTFEGENRFPCGVPTAATSILERQTSGPFTTSCRRAHLSASFPLAIPVRFTPPRAFIWCSTGSRR